MDSCCVILYLVKSDYVISNIMTSLSLTLNNLNLFEKKSVCSCFFNRLKSSYNTDTVFEPVCGYFVENVPSYIS